MKRLTYIGQFLLSCALLLSCWSGCAPAPLHLAIRANDVSEVEKTMRVSADGDWQKVLFMAIDECATKVGMQAIRHGADVNGVDRREDYSGYGWRPRHPLLKRASALHLALYRECYDLADSMISCGANVNRIDSTGASIIILLVQEAVSDCTPTHVYLVGPCDVEKQKRAIKYLIDRGANVNIRDNAGRTALGYAMMHRMAEKVEPERSELPGYVAAHIEIRNLAEGENVPEGFREVEILQDLKKMLQGAGAVQ